MSRFVKAFFAAAGLSLFAVGFASAAPKDAPAAGACEKATGKAVCCKASVADHCTYVSCCEVGNQGFFSKSSCGACAKGTAAKEMAHAKKAAHEAASTAKVSYVSCCEMGNRGFYTKAGACSTCEHKAACASCSAKK
jgi:hypothetical protein